ncbi:hypothetical protein QWY31_02775 [Cytophagales bacterium LB-30]|uniref:Uncharacterized protein n=1 Tax=Shiella aurantiaca TaxID=3058365 RepID=A0ABT8F1X9_9BACT|nr:hypothetical protein [Shiella aurantiaca]MDN4164405.1 hypothetical protein [Shiella aurantiaca]
MSVTRLKRKDRRNKNVANGRVIKIGQRMAKPVIKNVDIEELKASFATPAKKTTKKAAKAESSEEPSAE